MTNILRYTFSKLLYTVIGFRSKAVAAIYNLLFPSKIMFMNAVNQKWTIAMSISFVLLLGSKDLDAQQIFDAAGNAVVISNNANTTIIGSTNANKVETKKVETSKPEVKHNYAFRTLPQATSANRPNAEQLPFENYKGIKDLAEAKRVYISDLKEKYQNSPNKIGVFEPRAFEATIKQIEAMPTSGK